MNYDSAWELHNRHAQRLARGPGRVFTPRDVALQLARLTLEPLDEPPMLLDPACGAGALLLGALEWSAVERPHWLQHWLNGGLQGWDIDTANVAACNDVMAEALGLDVAAVASVRDGLEAAGEFDVVLANPPWVSFSGRHAVELAPARRAALAARFAAFAGWPALHTAFAEQCANLTRQELGRLGMLLPMQMADLAGYGAARRAVTARFSLQHALELGEGVFEGVTEPTGMFVFGAGGGSERPWLADSDAALLARVRRFACLPAESFGDVGVHTGNAAQLIVTREAQGRPLRVGRDIEPFRLANPSHWLREVELPQGRYARVAPEARYREALIVLRQTASRPIAAKHQPWALFRNSVLACYGAPGHDPDYLLGVLNSDIVARIHRAMFRDARQKAFPQVKVSHLRALPIPGRNIGGLYERIANIARSAQANDSGAHGQLQELVEQAYR
ncbi:MAG: N-6 DNA methylase [Planctomycetes bacterium]|nr:N-6 DNA methylase [Planctomycetota bacterium]MCB9935360.1 N-6 DNA methylase [Planctomycetota bacterium]